MGEEMDRRGQEQPVGRAIRHGIQKQHCGQEQTYRRQGMKRDDRVIENVAATDLAFGNRQQADLAGGRVGSKGEIQTETLPGAWGLSGQARRAYAERISLDLLAEI